MEKERRQEGRGIGGKWRREEIRMEEKATRERGEKKLEKRERRYKKREAKKGE